MTLEIVPVTFAEAVEFIAANHRHHRPPVGHKFSIGVVSFGETGPPPNRIRVAGLVGVACVGRPVARHFDDGLTLEVTRTATDGTPNANSMLYGAAWRAAKALGYRRLITYTQGDETGTSLHAAGWRVVAQRPASPGWTRPSRPRHDRGVDGIARTLWEAS